MKPTVIQRPALQCALAAAGAQVLSHSSLPSSSDTMALPRGMRILAGATLCILLFLVVELFWGEQREMEMPAKAPEPQKFVDWDHDPQQDRT